MAWPEGKTTKAEIDCSKLISRYGEDFCVLFGRSATLSALTHQTKQKHLSKVVFAHTRAKRTREFLQDREPALGLLQTLLEGHASRGAIDPRDKVYGLLRIATDFHEDELVPGYKLPVRVVHLVTIEEHLMKFDTLNILGRCYTTDTDTLFHQPSWIAP